MASSTESLSSPVEPEKMARKFFSPCDGVELEHCDEERSDSDRNKLRHF